MTEDPPKPPARFPSRSYWPREVMLSFLQLYRSLECLWRVRSPSYTNRFQREQAYQVLLNKVREVEPYADREYVACKINSIRTSFRKELAKVNRSKKLAAVSGGPVYKPRLWYYDYMMFIVDQYQDVKQEHSSEGGNEDLAWSEEEGCGSIRRAQGELAHGPRWRTGQFLGGMQRVSFMLSKQGRQLLVSENYTYSRYAELKSSRESAWKCSNKRCRAKVYTAGGEVSRSSGRHNHPPKDPRALTRARISNAVKMKATELMSELPAALIQSELREEDVHRLTPRDFKLIKDCIYRTRLPTNSGYRVPSQPILEKGDSEEAFDASQFMEEEFGNDEEEIEITETKPVILEDGSVLSTSGSVLRPSERCSVAESPSEERERKAPTPPAEVPPRGADKRKAEVLANGGQEGKRQRQEEDESLLRQAMAVILRARDEHVPFGEYVTNELRSLRTDRFRRRLKSRIRKAIAEVVDQECLYLDGED